MKANQASKVTTLSSLKGKALAEEVECELRLTRRYSTHTSIISDNNRNDGNRIYQPPVDRQQPKLPQSKKQCRLSSPVYVIYGGSVGVDILQVGVHYGEKPDEFTLDMYGRR